MTLPPNSYSELSSPVTAVGASVGTPARQFNEPLREMCIFALLAGNGVFLLLGVSGLFLVIERWATDFGLRSAAVFSTFVGPLALGLPLAAVLLATHVAPMVARTRVLLTTALVEYGVSAFFGTVTFLGAFAYDLRSVRATIEGLLGRMVWLGFLVFACVLLVRIRMGLFPAPKPQPGVYGGYRQTTYGKPYPGQPMYPQPTFQSGTNSAADTLTDPGGGWPPVPPPPMPAQPDVDADPTTRLLAVPQPPETGGEATQVVRHPSALPASPDGSAHAEPPTERFDR